MKPKIFICCVCFLLVFLLRYPVLALSSAREGLKLWLYTMIPTLLPFLILTGILIRTDGISRILEPFSPVTGKLLGLSGNGTYVMLLGLLCGYPMGAKLAHDLYCAGKISRREGEYLLTFCCNASPAFISSYLAASCLKNQQATGEIFQILFLSDLFCMMFFRFVIYRNHTTDNRFINEIKKETPQHNSPGVILDVSIMNGFETITRLGGYILLFSLLYACICHFWPLNPEIGKIVAGSLELTTGLNRLAVTAYDPKLQYLCSMALTAFGGFCILAQTRSVLENRLSLLPYITSKCLNTGITALLVLANII